MHPTGNPNSRQAALAFGEAHLLQEIITTIAYNPQGALAQYLSLLPPKISIRVRDELERRAWIAPVDGFMRMHSWREVIRLVLVKAGLSNRLGLNYQGLIDWIYTSLDRHVARHHLSDIDAIYCYEDGAATTFQAAKQQGILCLYDLPILFYRTSRTIQAQEAELFPELSPALQAVREPAWKIQRKEQEIQLADHIFVASSMTEKSLLDVGVDSPKNQCHSLWRTD